LILGEQFDGSLKDATVCISDADYDCYKDNIDDFITGGEIILETGEISYNE